MDLKQLDDILARTIADGRLSRGERQTLTQILEEAPDESLRGLFRSRAFDAARVAMDQPRAREVIGWLEDLVAVLAAGAPAARPGGVAEAHFSPGEACVQRIVGLLGGARRTADICVFTVTDNRIARAIHDAYRRGVQVRIVTDNEKAFDLGSDVDDLRRAGVPIAVDDSPFHMHHKFAVFDGKLLLTGSYNWTRGAAAENEENLVVTDDERLISAFRQEFDRLWNKFSA